VAEEVEWAKVSLSSRSRVVPSAVGPEENREKITTVLNVGNIDVEEEAVLVTALM